MIIYTIGDATLPNIQQDETAIIAHVCNDIGAWGAGFSGALGRRYPEAERVYRCSSPWHLGQTQIHPMPGTRLILVWHVSLQQGRGVSSVQQLKGAP